MPAPDEVYYPVRQLGRAGMNIVARTEGDPAALQSEMRTTVASADKDQPISFFSTLETNLAQSLGAQRIVASLTTISRPRARALGGRVVFGARLCRVAAHRGDRHPDGARCTARPGDRPGPAQRNEARRDRARTRPGRRGRHCAAIQTLLFEVRPLDPIVYAGVAAVFTVVATLACLMPSWRASRIDPLIALRAD